MRAALGFAFAGLYGVIESWINSKATNYNRCALYGIYKIVTFGCSGCGQFLLTSPSPSS